MSLAHCGIGSWLRLRRWLLRWTLPTPKPIIMKTTHKILTALALGAALGTIQADVLVYESFQGANYVPGSTLIGVTAQGTGLTGNWTMTGGASSDWSVGNATSMSYSSGNIAIDGGTKYGIASYVGTTAQAANVALSSSIAYSTTEATYVSFLIRYNGTLDTNDNMSLQLANTDSTTSISRSGVRDNGAGDVGWLANNASSTYIASPTLTAGTTYFMVLKLIGSGSNWQGTLWLNPDSTTVEGGGALGSVSMNLGGNLAINYLGFKLQNADAGDSLNLDEIRIGTSWADVVTVIPEPSTWALFAGGLTFLVIFRRRQSC